MSRKTPLLRISLYPVRCETHNTAHTHAAQCVSCVRTPEQEQGRLQEKCSHSQDPDCCTSEISANCLVSRSKASIAPPPSRSPQHWMLTNPEISKKKKKVWPRVQLVESFSSTKETLSWHGCVLTTIQMESMTVQTMRSHTVAWWTLTALTDATQGHSIRRHVSECGIYIPHCTYFRWKTNGERKAC